MKDLLDKKVIDVVCGEHHSLALTHQGEVYIWREIQDVAKELTRIPPTKLLSQLEDDCIISITSELNSILALTKLGFVHQWNPSTDSIGNVAQRIHYLDNIVKLVSGHDHTMALSTEGSLYIWGPNSCGQIGKGNLIRSLLPYKIKLQLVGHIVDIAAGQYISAAVNEKGQMYMWSLCCTQKILIPTSVSLSNVDDVILYFSSINQRDLIIECLTQPF